MDHILNRFVCAFLSLKEISFGIAVHSCFSPWYLGTVFATLQTMKYKKIPSLPVKRWKCFNNAYEESIDEETGLSANLMVARTWVLLHGSPLDCGGA